MTLSVRDAGRDAPNHTALVIGQRTWSFAELAAVVEPVIALLEEQWRQAPATSQSPLALVGASDLPTLAVLYALIELGWPVALVHPRFTDTERAALYPLIPKTRWLDARATYGLAATTSLKARAVSPPAKSSRVANVAAPIDEPVVSAALGARSDDERCLAILFTSGTTGPPKGIVLSRRAFAAGARASALNLGWREHDRWLLGLPIAHVGGLSILTRCLLARRAVVIPRDVAEGRRLTPEALRVALDELGVSIVSLVPTQLEWLLASGAAWSAPRALRAVLLGGAAASPRLLERAGERALPILTTYGLTEACSQVTT
ncbi:MAG TPA: AMP-binding protein, partial [Polyangiaceae bacterium]|nr:AMP-binding protein [Polyangiaceae bacterium]